MAERLTPKDIGEIVAGIDERVRKLERHSHLPPDIPEIPEGACPKEYATVVVAASDTHQSGKECADFVCSGTDDQTTLEQATASLPEGIGGKILLLEGNYFLSALWQLENSAGEVFHVQGMGGATVIHNSSNDWAISNFGNDYSSISWLRVIDSEYGVQLGSSGGVIHAVTVETSFDYVGPAETAIAATSSYQRVSDCLVRDQVEAYKRGIYMTGSQSTLTNSVIYNTGNGGSGTAALDVTGSNCTISNIIILSVGFTALRSTGSSTRIGEIYIEDAGAGGIFVTGSGTSVMGCHVRNALYGITSTGSEVSILGCRLDGCEGGDGINLTGSASTVQGNVITFPGFKGIKNTGSYSRILGNVIDGAGEEGIHNNGGSVGIIGNIIRAEQHGIYLTDCADGTVQGNNIRGCGIDGSTYDGIHLNDVDRHNIQGNTVREEGAGTRYGINVATAACDDNFVTNNDLLNSAVTASLNDAGTGTVTASMNRV